MCSRAVAAVTWDSSAAERGLSTRQAPAAPRIRAAVAPWSSSTSEVGRGPAPQVRLDALLERGEPVGLGLEPVLVPGEIGEGGAALQGECGAQGAGGVLGGARVELGGALAGEALEDVQLDVVRAAW